MKTLNIEEFSKIKGTTGKRNNPITDNLTKLELNQTLEVDFDETESNMPGCIQSAKIRTGFKYSMATLREARKWYVTRIK